MTQELFLLTLSVALIAVFWMVVGVVYSWAYYQPVFCPEIEYPNAILI